MDGCSNGRICIDQFVHASMRPCVNSSVITSVPTELRLYNTLTRSQEPFAPSRDNTVRMYACGPTVYARAHIGNFRTFICVDVLRRALRHLCGHKLREVVNYTDVDDKTIAGAQQANV